jgi:protein phosphatase
LLKIGLAQIIKESIETSLATYNEVIENSTAVLQNENGNVGNLEIIGRLVKMKPSGNAVIVGDLHGDLESLVHILQRSNIIRKMEDFQTTHLIFLGDYGDRGNFSPEVIQTVLKLKLLFPSQVVLMRGNHESPKDILAYPHDLPDQLRKKFGEAWTETYEKTFELYKYLYTAVVVEDRYLLVHGGPSSQAVTIADLADAARHHPRSEVLADILWSDPSDSVQGVNPSPRGAGKFFGKDVTTKVLDAFKVHILIRGHESCDNGFRIDHDGKVLTLFSRKGLPYYNEHGAYLDLQLCKEFMNAELLIPYIHQF